MVPLGLPDLDYPFPAREETSATHGKRDVEGVPRLMIEVRDESGELVYHTWNAGTVRDWDSVTLHFETTSRDAEGREIGYSTWR